jgi:hypothetical protein
MEAFFYQANLKERYNLAIDRQEESIKLDEKIRKGKSLGNRDGGSGGGTD